MKRNLKATYVSGDLVLDEPLPLRDGTQVEITLRSTKGSSVRESREADEGSWDALLQLLSDCAIDTGIPDFARAHDRYLYGSGSLGRDKSGSK